MRLRITAWAIVIKIHLVFPGTLVKPWNIIERVLNKDMRLLNCLWATVTAIQLGWKRTRSRQWNGLDWRLNKETLWLKILWVTGKIDFLIQIPF